MTQEVFIVAGARTAIGRHRGQFASVRPDDLAATALEAAVDRAGVPVGRIDEVVLGAANQAGEDNRNIARMATLLAGLGTNVPGYTINRLCASGLTAAVAGQQSIVAGVAQVVAAGGVESMTRAPWVVAKPDRAWRGPTEVAETNLGWRFINPRMYDIDDGDVTVSMGETAERVADLYKIDRVASDEFALRSHQLASHAAEAGHFAAEIVPVEVKETSLSSDEGPRAGLTIEQLQALSPVFRTDGVVTAGSSSSLSDGAAALVLASGTAVEELGLTPWARVVATGVSGVRPSLMGLGPVDASRQALKRASWTVQSLQSVELNEAFAPQALACIEELGLDPDLVNPAGGAIALGHPLGMSGARILLTLSRRLHAEGPGARGLATLCVGVGQGVSVLIESC